MAKTQDEIYQKVTDKIVSLLEGGTVPWLKPWNPVEEMPVNAVTKRPYHGVNVWMLLYSGFTCRFWATFKQINDMGGKLKKGSKGQTVVFWNFIKKEVENNDGETQIKYFLGDNIDKKKYGSYYYFDDALEKLKKLLNEC